MPWADDFLDYIRLASSWKDFVAAVRSSLPGVTAGTATHGSAGTERATQPFCFAARFAPGECPADDFQNKNPSARLLGRQSLQLIRGRPDDIEVPWKLLGDRIGLAKRTNVGRSKRLRRAEVVAVVVGAQGAPLTRLPSEKSPFVPVESE